MGLVVSCAGGFGVFVSTCESGAVGFESPGKEVEMNGVVNGNVEKVESEEAGLHKGENVDVDVDVDVNAHAAHAESSSAIGFLEAWRLPGVAPFAFCLFFSKLVSYTFLYWLPFYIRHTVGKELSIPCSSKLSTEDLEAEIFLHLLRDYSRQLDRKLSGKVFLEAANYQLKRDFVKKGGQLAAINLESRVALLAAKQGFAGASVASELK